jgi:hypothetical protein
MRPLSPVVAQNRPRRVFRAALLSVTLLGCAPWVRIPATRLWLHSPPPPRSRSGSRDRASSCARSR